MIEFQITYTNSIVWRMMVEWIEGMLLGLSSSASSRVAILISSRTLPLYLFEILCLYLSQDIMRLPV